MKRRLFSAGTIIAVLSLLGYGLAARPQTAKAVNFGLLNEIQDRLLSGMADLELNPTSQQAASTQQQPTQYFPRGSDACAVVNSSNVKVNQNCLNVSDSDLAGRGQAQNETSIAQDPNQPNHIIASYNDYRRGDGNCYT